MCMSCAPTESKDAVGHGLYSCRHPVISSIMLGTQQELNEYLLINGT